MISCSLSATESPEQEIKAHVEVCMLYINNIIKNKAYKNEYQRGYQQGLYEAYRDVSDLMELIYTD